MFEISQLKEKKLTDLQEIAKKLNVPKYRSMKKLDLVYQILDQQAADPKAVKAVVAPEPSSETKTQTPPARKPRQRVQKPARNEQQQTLLSLKIKKKKSRYISQIQDRAMITRKNRIQDLTTIQTKISIKTRKVVMLIRVIKIPETVIVTLILSLMPLLKAKAF